MYIGVIYLCQPARDLKLIFKYSIKVVKKKKKKEAEKEVKPPELSSYLKNFVRYSFYVLLSQYLR